VACGRSYQGEDGVGVAGGDFQQVLNATTGGDERAFAALWRAHQPMLLRYLKVLAPDAAEDLASETWLVVTRTLARFQGGEGGFRAWLLTIARRQARDWRRQQARRPLAALAPEELPHPWAPEDPAMSAMETLSTEAALTLVASLPPDQAEVVALRVVAGLDVAQTAAIVGKRPGTVRVLAHRGLRRLAERLAAQRQPEGV
jgi:RNA polymerase sigma-70 factor (ECF subfamily)